MKGFLRSKLFLTLAALLLIAGAFAGPLSSSILHAYAQGPISPPAGLVSWWPGDGNYNDIVGSNNLTPQGSITFGTGEVRQAFLLDGITAAADAGNAPSLQLSSGDFTVDTWVEFNVLSHPPGFNIGAPAGDMSIVDKMFARNGIVNSDGWRLIKQDDNHFWFCLGGINFNGCVASSAYTVRSSTSVTTGTWYHVAAVKSSNGIAIYVNGNLEDSKPLPTFTDTNSTDLLIGANTAEGSHLNGLIDEVQIFNRALSGSEIQAIYNAGSAGQIKAPAEINHLINLVNSFHLSSSLQTALDNKLQDVLTAITAGQTATACSELTDFIGFVQSHTGKGISTSQAKQLIAAAQQIQAVLGC